jgi:hypothetical protein
MGQTFTVQAYVWNFPSGSDTLPHGGMMTILAAIRREERKLEKELKHIQNRLDGIRAAAKALGLSTSREVKAVRKRVLSAAGRARIVAAAKRRWAKARAAAKKAAR